MSDGPTGLSARNVSPIVANAQNSIIPAPAISNLGGSLGTMFRTSTMRSQIDWPVPTRRCLRTSCRFVTLFAAAVFFHVAPAAGQATLKIATLKLQNFGAQTASDAADLTVLAETIRRYQIVAVQGIAIDGAPAMNALIHAINSGGRQYRLILSEPSGRDPDDGPFRQRYGFIYDADQIRPTGAAAALFDDRDRDLFDREPFMKRFRSVNGTFSFMLITVDVSADEAKTKAEIDAMADAVAAIRRPIPYEDDYILLGNFNAACDYINERQLARTKIAAAPFIWFIGNDTDTDIGEGACAYDRIVGSEATRADYAGIQGVDRVFGPGGVSDHLPVWAEFWSNEFQR